MAELELEVCSAVLAANSAAGALAFSVVGVDLGDLGLDLLRGSAGRGELDLVGGRPLHL